MIKPTIHLNGTSREQLHAAYMGAYVCLQQAVEAVRATSPNGRDYYPLGNEAIRDAEHEHRKRLEMLEQVRAEIEELCEHTLPPPRARIVTARSPQQIKRQRRIDRARSI